MKKKIISAFLFILLFPALLLILPGEITWNEGRIFSVWFILLCFSTILYLYRNDPALLEERYRQPGTENQELWDRYIVYGILAGFISGLSLCRLMPNGSDGPPFLPSG